MQHSPLSSAGVTQGIASASQHLPQIDTKQQGVVHSSKVEVDVAASQPVAVASVAGGAAVTQRGQDISYYELLRGGAAGAHVRRYANIQEYLRVVLEDDATREKGTTTPAVGEERGRKDADIISKAADKTDARRQVEQNTRDTFTAVSESRNISDLAETRGLEGRASFIGGKESSPASAAQARRSSSPSEDNSDNNLKRTENASTFFDKERDRAYVAPDGSILLVARLEAQQTRSEVGSEEKGVVGGEGTLLSEGMYPGRGGTTGAGDGVENDGDDYRSRYHVMSGRPLLFDNGIPNGKRTLTGIHAMCIAGVEEISADEKEGVVDEDAMMIDAFSHPQATGQQRLGHISQRKANPLFVSVGRSGSLGGKESGGERAHSANAAEDTTMLRPRVASFYGSVSKGSANTGTTVHSNGTVTDRVLLISSSSSSSPSPLFTKGRSMPSDEWIRTQLRRHRAFVTPMTPVDLAELSRRSEAIRVDAHRRRVEERYGHLRSPDRARGLVSVLIPSAIRTSSPTTTPIMSSETNPTADLVFRGEIVGASEGAECDTVNINALNSGRPTGNNNAGKKRLPPCDNTNTTNTDDTIFTTTNCTNGNGDGNGKILLVPASSRPLPYLSFEELAAINEMVESEMEEFKKRQQRKDRRSSVNANTCGSAEGSSLRTPQSRRPESRMLSPSTGGRIPQKSSDYSLATLRTRRPNTAPTASAVAASSGTFVVRRTVPKEISRRLTSPFHATNSIDNRLAHAKKRAHVNEGEHTVAKVHLDEGLLGNQSGYRRRREEGSPHESAPRLLPLPASGPEQFVQYVRQVAATRGVRQSDIYPLVASVGFEGSGDRSNEKVLPVGDGRRKENKKNVKRSEEEQESGAILLRSPAERFPLRSSSSRAKRAQQQVRGGSSLSVASDWGGGVPKMSGGGGSPVNVVRRRRNERHRQEESELSEWAHRIRRDGFHI